MDTSGIWQHFRFSDFTTKLVLIKYVFRKPETSQMSDTPTAPEKGVDAAADIFPLSSSLPLFQAFDAAADAEQELQDPDDFDESRERLSALIDKLPQRNAIKDDHAKRWLERTMRTAVERMELEHGEGNATVGDVHRHVFWHVRRASGIGGSEAGTVLKHYRGKKGTFGDAHNLVLEKLLIMSPQPSTEEMARGVRAEPWVQRMYHEHHGVKSDEKDLEKLKNFRWAKRPASVGTPDDIVNHIVGEFAGLKRCLDYKAPSAAVVEDYETNGVSMDYVCQVHHYGILQLASGSKFDVMSIEAFDPRSFKILSFPVEFDIKLAKEISDSCHRLWHENVMLGVVPDAPAPDDLNVKDEKLIEIGVQAAFIKVLGDELTKRQKALLESISIMGSEWHDIATGKMELSVASFSRTRKWDEEKLRDIAEAADIDVAPFEIADKKGKVDAQAASDFLVQLHDALKEEDADSIKKLLDDYTQSGAPIVTKLDADKLAEHLEENGFSTIEAAQVGEAFRLSQKKKGPEFERLSHLRTEVSDLVDGLEVVAQEHAPKIIKGEETEEKDFDASMDMA
ncbi:YqaJ viral recombinase family protein [Epibacterium sp. DP7N7-1]|nr:YqaJ viral recombinase family protein [Epibacterium sp. DP7N7-1]